MEKIMELSTRILLFGILINNIVLSPNQIVTNALLVSPSECNEAVCGSIVSKCTLLKSCECKIEADKPCTCCKRCFACLEYLQPDCCSCFGLCPSNDGNSSIDASNSRSKSMVGEIANPTPQLWDALMEGGDDTHGRWTTKTFPVDKELPTSIQDTISQNLVSKNCTVSYLSSEMSDTKCSKSCSTMGATAYRWFTNGCCQCVGHECVNYGINQPQCTFIVNGENVDTLDGQLDYANLSDEELRALEAEYGLLEDPEEL